jgi:hypothetical protein
VLHTNLTREEAREIAGVYVALGYDAEHFLIVAETTEEAA